MRNSKYNRQNLIRVADMHPVITSSACAREEKSVIALLKTIFIGNMFIKISKYLYLPSLSIDAKKVLI